MEGLSLLLLIAALTSFNVVTAIESFLFTQCECRDALLVANDVTENPLVSDLTIGGSFDCPTGAERGFTRVYDGGNNFIIGTLSEDFFFLNGERRFWFGAMDIRLDNLQPGITINVLEFDLFNANVRLRIERELDGSLSVGRNSATLDPQEEYTVIFGEGDDGSDFVFAICIIPRNVDGDPTCAAATNTAPIGGDVENSIGDRPFTIFENTFNDGSFLTIQTLAFDTSDPPELRGFGSGNIGGVLKGLVAANFDFSIGALPVFNGAGFETNEDEVFNGDLNNLLVGSAVALQFNVEAVGKFGTFEILNNVGGFRFTPNDNLFGDETINFNYSSSDLPYVCELNVDDAVLTILEVNDVPILLDIDPITAIAFINSPQSELVAIDVDIVEDDKTLLEGTVTITVPPQSGSLREFDCGEELIEGSTVTLVNGEFQYCYIGDENNINGDQDSFSYTVSEIDDINEVSLEGTILINGETPVLANGDNEARLESGNEDTNININLDGRFAEKAAGAEELDFTIRVTRLPNPNQGTLKFNGVDVIVGQPFQEGQTLTFEPELNFANSGGNRLNRDENNQPFVDVGGCPNTLVQTDVCPVVFEYVVVLGSTDQQPPSQFNIIVEAVEDPGAQLAPKEVASVVADINEQVNNFIQVPVEGFQIENADDLFQVFIFFEGSGGVEVFHTDSLGIDDSQGFDSLDPLQENGLNCLEADPCSALRLSSVPGRINAFLNSGKLFFKVPVEEVNNQPPAFQVFVSNNENVPGGPAFSTDFAVEEVEDDFFDDQNNILYAAAGVGGILLLGIIFGIVRYTTVHADERGKAFLDEEKPKQFQARGATRGTTQRKRSFTEDEEEAAPEKIPATTGKVPAEGGDDLLDWEKHIDPKTKEPFYYNPSTGETVWELPDI